MLKQWVLINKKKSDFYHTFEGPDTLMKRLILLVLCSALILLTHKLSELSITLITSYNIFTGEGQRKEAASLCVMETDKI